VNDKTEGLARLVFIAVFASMAILLTITVTVARP